MPPCFQLEALQVGHLYVGPGFVSMSPQSMRSRGRKAGEFLLPFSEKTALGVWCNLLLVGWVGPAMWSSLALRPRPRRRVDQVVLSVPQETGCVGVVPRGADDSEESSAPPRHHLAQATPSMALVTALDGRHQFSFQQLSYFHYSGTQRQAGNPGWTSRTL